LTVAAGALRENKLYAYGHIQQPIFMLTLILQAARRRTTTNRSWTAAFRHLGAFGLFLLAILDSSPIPTFGGPDILIAILAASHRNPWYEYAAVATAGSLIGAYITFHLAQRAGVTWL
jgi:membrane protein DedA with SNARE-associated domain